MLLREIAELRRNLERTEAELAKARKVILGSSVDALRLWCL